jgi:hypothetical protein
MKNTQTNIAGSSVIITFCIAFWFFITHSDKNYARTNIKIPLYISQTSFEFVWAYYIAYKLFSNTPAVQIEIGTGILENIGTVKKTKISFQIDYIAAMSSALNPASRVNSLSSSTC